MTNPQTWGDAITILPNGSITTLENGVVTIITRSDTPKEAEEAK